MDYAYFIGNNILKNMDWSWTLLEIGIYGAATALTFLLIISVVIFFTTRPYPVVKRYQEEECYYDTKSTKILQFPTIDDSPTINLSVVVPAYNEEERLPPMLDETLKFLEARVKQHPSYKYEVIVVSDGSKDSTVRVAQSYSEKYGSDKVRCLQLVKNRGKGGAVKLGVECSRGACILFADADGATKFEDLTKLEDTMKDITQCDPVVQIQVSEGSAVVVGSRAHLEQESLAKRSIFRNVLMFGFHALVGALAVRGVRDTQCGFKLFSRRTARTLFRATHLHGWAFDVELLYIAQRLNIPIAEIQVRWTEIEGSKVTPVLSWIQMGIDLILIWFRYQIGAWKIKSDKLD